MLMDGWVSGLWWYQGTNWLQFAYIGRAPTEANKSTFSMALENFLDLIDLLTDRG